MVDRCPECGAPVPAGRSCQDNFHAMLALEAEIPGGPSSIAHFYAVGAYNLQHPDTQRLTAEALLGLRQNLAEVLDGRATLEQIRRQVRRSANGPARVLRRPGEPPPAWRRGNWSMHVVDACAGGAAEYEQRVAGWARTVCATLAADN